MPDSPISHEKAVDAEDKMALSSLGFDGLDADPNALSTETGACMRVCKRCGASMPIINGDDDRSAVRFKQSKLQHEQEMCNCSKLLEQGILSRRDFEEGKPRPPSEADAGCLCHIS